MTQQFHPWLDTPEALSAARRAVSSASAIMGGRARLVGADELLSQALVYLTECALPPREVQRALCARCQEPLINVRAGAKFCSPNCRKQYAVGVQRGKAEAQPPRSGAHVGSMHEWPEADRGKYATRQVAYCLNNWLRTLGPVIEYPASVFQGGLTRETCEYTPAFFDVADETSGTHARDTIEAWLESKGAHVTGDETIEELEQAVYYALERARAEPVAA